MAGETDSADAASPGSSSAPGVSKAPPRSFSRRRGSDTQGLLAFIVIFTLVAVVVLICWHSVPVENKDALEILIGVIAGSYKDVVSFFFGSTSSAHEKDTAIAAIATNSGAAAAAPFPAGPKTTTITSTVGDTITSTTAGEPGKGASGQGSNTTGN